MKTLFRVVDFETTGVNTEDEKHAICEIGWCDVRLIDGNWRVDDVARSMLINPGRPMPVPAMAIHHITDEELSGAPDQPAGFRLLMNGMDADASAFVAHNADFEREFFSGGNVPWICTYKSALRIWPDAPSHSNQVLRYHLNLGLDHEKAMPPHRAGPDAFVTAWILSEILASGADPDELIRWSDGPALLPKINFGKHRGEKWEDVPLDYLRWIAEKSDMGRDAKANAKYWLKKRGG